MRVSKRRKMISEKVKPGQLHTVEQAVKLLQEFPAKFKQRVEVAINLGIDTKKSDQTVRGAVVLPHGTGREVRVAVFAQGDQAKAAQAAGADIVGFEDLAEAIKGGEINFDVLVATPDAMRLVGQLGQILGPRGLMPNPKVGTVTANAAEAVKNAKGGQVRYRADKAGIVHAAIGVIDFAPNALLDNLKALLVDVKKSKPSTSKGTYIKKVTLSSTMGPGLVLDQAALDEKAA